jgi:lipopolysaccharide biosynthesis glycosyltransferase
MKTAIVSMAFGSDWWRVGSVSFAAMSVYAERLMSDFIVFSRRRFPAQHVHWEKLSIFNLFDTYDRIAWIDADVIVRPDAPSIFDAVPYDVISALEQGPGDVNSLTDLANCAAFYEAPYVTGPNPRYFNAGVMVLSRCHSNLFAEPKTFFNGINPEQTFLNFRRHQLGFAYEPLSWKWNMIPALWPDGDYRSEARFIHYAGYPKYQEYVAKLNVLMREDLARWGYSVL